MSCNENIIPKKETTIHCLDHKTRQRKKTPFLVFSLLGLFLLSLVLFLQLNPFISQGKVFLESTELDFGELECGPEGVVALRTIKLKNSTNDTINIKEFAVSCECLKIQKHPDSILPKDEGIFELQVTLKPKDVQERSVNVIIMTDNPSYPKLNFSVRARLKASFYALPGELDFGIIIDKERNYTKTLFVNQFGFPENVRISKVVSNAKAVAIGEEKISRQETRALGEGRIVFERNSEYLVTLHPSALSLSNNGIQNPIATITFFLSNGKTLDVPVKYEF